MINIHELDRSEIDIATETIFKGFCNDPMMLWLFGGEDGYKKHAKFAIRTWVRWAILYGLAIGTDNCEAVALRKKPGKLHFSFWNMFRSGMLGYPKVLGKEIFKRFILLGKVITAEQNKNMENQKFWYCWVIVVSPDKMRRGLGRALANYTFALAKKDNLPCYLETSTALNLIIHGKNGFNLVSEVAIPESQVVLYSMVKSSY